MDQPPRTARRHRVNRNGLWLCLGLVACVSRAPELTPAQQGIAEFRGYVKQSTGEPNSLFLVSEKALKLAEAFPADRQVLLLAGEAQRAYGYEGDAEDAAYHFGIGRELGRQCLRTSGAWVVMEEIAGGRVTPAGLRRFEAPDLPCLRMLLANWLRWVEHSGHSSTVDLRPLELIAERVLELTVDEERHWRDHWAMGMAIGLNPAVGDRLADADFHFRKAEGMVPDLATPVIDRLAVYAAQKASTELVREELRGLRSKNYSTHQSSEWGLQNQRALKRAINLLGQLREE